VNVQIIHFSIKKTPRNILKLKLAGSHLCSARQDLSLIGRRERHYYFFVCSMTPVVPTTSAQSVKGRPCHNGRFLPGLNVRTFPSQGSTTHLKIVQRFHPKAAKFQNCPKLCFWHFVLKNFRKFRAELVSSLGVGVF
jgi:hypothetical protein